MNPAPIQNDAGSSQILPRSLFAAI